MSITDGSCESVYSTRLTAIKAFGVTSVTTRTGAFSGGDSISMSTTTRWNNDQPDKTTVLSFGTMTADSVVIYWQSTDLSLFEPKYASALANRLGLSFSPTAEPTAGVASAKPSATSGLPASTGMSEPSNGSSSLSTGAKAGVGIGAALGALIVAAGIFFFYRRNRRRRGNQGSNYHNPGMSQRADMPELVSTSRVASPR